MININLYNNGYEIKGHAKVAICHQVSLWHWISSNLILGLDKTAKEYTSWRDNAQNPNEGYSWVTYTNIDKWLVDDLVISAETWSKEYWKGQVNINRINKEMIL